jgi:hypothetical protein
MPTSFDGSRRISVGLLALTTLVGCASAPVTRRLGDYGSAAPSFVVPPGTKSAERATVTLAKAAYVALLYVVPGRGSVVVYPNDTTAYNYVDAGAHDVRVYFPTKPMNRDSLHAAARRQAARGTNYNRPPRPTRADSLESEASRGKGPIAEPSPASSPVGYLLLVTSPSTLSLSRIKHRVEGLTIPFEDAEALQTVMKLVKATLPDGASLAGYAQEVER